ncbi:hypothetical protein NM688_g550 [Phlebia brevispora]|uniref:Uncharacterized protein n=1 Tax=Phlebia brevispora TaxID=194682 RepID=A0ACC1TE10_9APHY|nr:hypothetical protein NM688_g550 [Phlebia brevispora]
MARTKLSPSDGVDDTNWEIVDVDGIDMSCTERYSTPTDVGYVQQESVMEIDEIPPLMPISDSEEEYSEDDSDDNFYPHYCGTDPTAPSVYGGARKGTISVRELQQHETYAGTLCGLNGGELLTLSTILAEDEVNFPVCQYKVILKMPLPVLARMCTKQELKKIYDLHHVRYPGNSKNIAQLVDIIDRHVCHSTCKCALASFNRPLFDTSLSQPTVWRAPINPQPEVSLHVTNNEDGSPCKFPPAPHDIHSVARFVQRWIDATRPSEVAQTPCGICARQLFPKETTQISLCDSILKIMYDACERATEGRVKRTTPDGIMCKNAVEGEGINKTVTICYTCLNSLKKKKTIPRLAMANGLWLGDVPAELNVLNFVEKLLVARYRHNVCTAEIRKGGVRRRMKANAVVFAQPVAKFHAVLPPPRNELDECLVILFTGATDLTKEDFQRTPFLVRRDIVWNALVWLKENHRDYRDARLSRENLITYPEETPPVAVFHNREDAIEPVENRAVFDADIEKGTDDGPCQFAVHGMTAEEYNNLSCDQRKLKIAEHLRLGRGVLAYGSHNEPELIFHNPRMYPGLFPWLFPYGLGGFENELQTRAVPMRTHIKYLLAYHDGRFQRDEYFPFLLFNQEQIRECSYGGYSLVHKGNFRKITEKILNLEVDALASLIEKAKISSYVQPDTDGEKRCLEVLHLMDVVAGRVPISNTQKKYQRNEIRGLIYAKGLPFWFVTFAPAEQDNIIALMMSGVMSKDDAINLRIPDKSDRLKSIAANPVACAKFFNFLVKTFISIILCAGTDEDGLFGKTSAYYGTVESQGRLTLHLHLLIWIEGSYTPSEIRARVLSNVDEFRGKMIRWLESCHQGQFSTGSMSEIYARRIARNEVLTIDDGDQPGAEENELEDVNNPCLRRPLEPPKSGGTDEIEEWYRSVILESDDLAVRCNKHTHHKDSRLDSCRKGVLHTCRAWFPRALIPETVVEEETGAIFLKKRES